jgi:hypothetical protein
MMVFAEIYCSMKKVIINTKVGKLLDANEVAVSAVCSPAYIAPTVQHLPDVLERVQLLQ